MSSCDRGDQSLARVSIGDESGQRELARPHRGRGSFDYVAYLRRAGVRTVLHADRVRSTGRRRDGLTGTLDGVRRRAEAGRSKDCRPPMGALARGMVLGADEDIPAAMSDDFKASGLAHVLAVSGQNVALRRRWRGRCSRPPAGRRGRLIGVAVLIALYVPVTGAGPSILRAGVMGRPPSWRPSPAARRRAGMRCCSPPR